MKHLLLVLFVGVLSPVAKATVVQDIKSLTMRGEVRSLGPIKGLLERRLANEYDIHVDAKTGQASINITTKFNGFNAWRTYPADVKIEIRYAMPDAPDVVGTLSTKCRVEVNDGGNQTLKYSCVRKLARIIADFTNS